MAIENFEEVQQYISDNLDKDENVKNYVSGFVTQDRVNNFLSTEDGKRFLQPTLDSYFSKGLETFKQKTMPTIIDEEVKKRFPDIDPKDKQIAELKQQFEQMQKDALKKEITIKTSKVMQEKKLPLDLLDFLIGADEDTTMANLNALEKVFAPTVEALVTERLGSGYVPPSGKPPASKITKEQFEKMSYAERVKFNKEQPDLYKEFTKK